MSDFCNETMISLLQAINIEKGNIPVEKVSNLPAETYRVIKSFNDTTTISVTSEEKQLV